MTYAQIHRTDVLPIRNRRAMSVRNELARVVHSVSMLACLCGQQPATKHDGYNQHGRQRYSCRPCRRAFTATSTSAFSGHRWPADVILTGVRWSTSYSVSVFFLQSHTLTQKRIAASGQNP